MLSFLEKEEFISTHKTLPKYFTRDRIWNFKTAFLFICSMLNKRVQTEVDDFFSKLTALPVQIRLVTASAFTQCRDKISYTAFKSIFHTLTQYYYDNFRFQKYNGLRLIAIDGSVYTLPKTKETVKIFGDNVLSGNGKWIKAQVSFAADVLNNVCVDAVMGPYLESEHVQATTLFGGLGKGNLYLFDRGYFGRAFLKKVVDTGCQFCFRVQRNACKEVMNFVAGDTDDLIEHIQVDESSIKVRLTKVVLDTGEVEFLLTSLFDSDLYSTEELKRLYHMRWGVEEQFKDMKHAICVENFVGKKPNSIKQEFYANILTYNLSMMICKSESERISNKPNRKNKKKKRHKHKANKRAILAKMKQCFVDLFFRTVDLSMLISQIIKTVAKESVPIRNGRKAERGRAHKVKRKVCRAYVSVV